MQFSHLVLPQPTTSARLKARLLPQRPDPKILYQHQAAAHFSKGPRNVSAISTAARPGPNLSFYPESQKKPQGHSGVPLSSARDTGGGSTRVYGTDPSHCTDGRARRQTSSWLLLTAGCFSVKQAVLFRWLEVTHLTFNWNRKEDKPLHCQVPTTGKR